VPRRAVTHFVPRVEVQKELEDWLRNKSPSHMFVLQGIGGSGKTQVAFWCCQMAQESGFLATLWINASSPSTVAQSYRAISHLISPGNEIRNGIRETILLVRNHIERWTGRWLLVFDNYDNPKAFTSQAIGDYIPCQGGHILFTSRHKDSSRLGYCVDLSRMTEDESAELLLQATSTFENSEVAEVIATLGYLALALHQAGAYIRARGLPLSQFTAHYKRRRQAVLKEIPDEWEYRNFQTPGNEQLLSAFTTWETSLDLIKGTSKKEDEQKVHFLTLASFLDPYQISERYFRTYSTVDTNWMELLKNGAKWDTNKLADLLAEFQRLSLIQSFEHRENEHAFSIHPLICDWMKFRKGTATTSRVIELTNLLATFVRAHDLNYLPLEVNQETTRHIDAWVEANEYILQDSYKSILTMHNKSIGLFANVYTNQGRYEEAEQLYGRALEGYEEKLGPEHPDTLSTVQNLAVVYQDLGRYEEAEQLCHRALEGREEKLGPMHPATLSTIQSLAAVCRDRGRYEDAELLCHRALEGREETLGPQHPDTLNTVQNLATVYRDQGQYEKAEQLYHRALEGREGKLGPKHPDTLSTVQNLAAVYRDQDRYEEAEQLYRRALKGREEKLGPEHPVTLSTVQNLAVVYRNQGRYEEAKQLYHRALKGSEKKLGPQHPDTLRTVQNLAVVYRNQGRYEEAEKLYRWALEGREEKLGPKHPDTLRTTQNLAVVYRDQDRYEEAEELYGRALEGYEEKLGPKHPETLRTIQNLAAVYRNQGRCKEAEQLFLRVLEGREEKLGPKHPDTLRTIQNLAAVYRDQGRYEEAEQLFLRALEGYEEKLGPKHLDTLSTVQNLAAVYRDLGRYEEAKQLFQRVLEGYEEKLGPKHPDTLSTAQSLGDCLPRPGPVQG
jgi:tetratricopeptide (TPR) repeat protein